MGDGTEFELAGTVLSRGIAIGCLYVLDSEDNLISEIAISEGQIELEIERYRSALLQSRHDIENLKIKLENEGINEGALVLEAHVHITFDPLLNAKMEDEIRKTSKNAEFVFQNFMQKYSNRLKESLHPAFHERVEDVRDITKRVLEYLHKSCKIPFEDLPVNAVIVAHSMTPSKAAEASCRTSCAFVTNHGGRMSHTAIIARAKGIPYVTHVDLNEFLPRIKNKNIIVDGFQGKIIFNPKEKTIERYLALQKKFKLQFDRFQSDNSAGVKTKDGTKVRLLANVEIIDDFSELRHYHPEGVGLFRTEYLVLRKGSIPTEDEQYFAYKKLCLNMKDHPVVIRVFDLGLDKIVAGFQGANNDFMSKEGSRTLRFLLNEQELFISQVRAILKASLHADVRILLPMISTLSELRHAKELIALARQSLIDDGFTIKNVKLGCMIELPCAAMISDKLAQECDFISIGTNDLIQYALAIDRTSYSSSSLFTSTHPGVLLLVKIIAEHAHKIGIPVCVCGEMASDPRFVPFLLGLGIDELSVSSRFLPIIRKVVQNITIAEAQSVAKRVLDLSLADEIHKILIESVHKHIPQSILNHFI